MISLKLSAADKATAEALKGKTIARVALHPFDPNREGDGIDDYATSPVIMFTDGTSLAFFAALLNPDRESGVRLVPEAHYIVTYRTRDGGRHRFEHFTSTSDFREVRKEVVAFIARRFILTYVEPGTVVVQRLRSREA